MIFLTGLGANKGLLIVCTSNISLERQSSLLNLHKLTIGGSLLKSSSFSVVFSSLASCASPESSYLASSSVSLIKSLNSSLCLINSPEFGTLWEIEYPFVNNLPFSSSCMVSSYLCSYMEGDDSWQASDFDRFSRLWIGEFRFTDFYGVRAMLWYFINY